MRWETKQTFDGQLYQEYSYQNLFKSDHFSIIHDKQNFDVLFDAHSIFSLCYFVFDVTLSDFEEHACAVVVVFWSPH